MLQIAGNLQTYLHFTKNILYRNPDGTIRLRNPNIKNLKEDYLYHLTLGTATHDLPKMFGDIKVNF